MMANPRLVRLSKLLSLMLRHEPQRFGLLLDPEGYVSLQEVLTAARTRMPEATEADLFSIVEVLETQKRRFTILDGEIRANYGHSFVDRIAHAQAEPPAVLFHGTTTTAVAKIREVGILPMKRQYVHLTTDRDLAARVGSRHGAAQILEIEAAKASENGIAFYRANETFWLADQVPATYVR